LEAETNKYCPGGYDIGAISNLITWVLNFFLVHVACPGWYQAVTHLVADGTQVGNRPLSTLFCMG
jgi:hypothetical protein